ncbi:hypothetical protein GQ457_17G007120 [Hibiscus cannabinus]
MEENISRIRTITFDTSTMEINFTSKKFDFCQYLCSHALRILSVKNINKIPEQYITKRWTKDAKKNVHADKIDEFSQQNTIEADIESVFRNRMNLCTTKTFELTKDKIQASKVTTQTRNVRRSLIEELPTNDDEIVEGCANNNSHVLEPLCVRLKGISNVRLKCHPKKRKSKASTVHSNALNFPHRIVQQNNAATTLNLSQISNERRMNESNMFYAHNYGFTPNVKETYKYMEGHPNPEL